MDVYTSRRGFLKSLITITYVRHKVLFKSLIRLKALTFKDKIDSFLIGRDLYSLHKTSVHRQDVRPTRWTDVLVKAVHGGCKPLPTKAGNSMGEAHAKLENFRHPIELLPQLVLILSRYLV